MTTKLQSLLLCSLLLLVVAQSYGAAEQPDIVFFITDDHSAADSPVYGAKELRTPNMEKLAETGLTFENAFVASPSCAPSRAALLTGLMPARNGAEANHSKPRPELKKWPAYFQELGYEVVAFGKVSHYQHTKDYGFDHFAHDTFHDHAAIPAAAEFLKKRDPNSTRPLCLFVGSNWPHVPWPEEFEPYEPTTIPLPESSIDTTETRRFRAMFAAAVTKADEDLGMVYNAARATLDKNAIYIITSDHGTQWPFGKWNCYDAGIRVPLIVVWEGLTKPGARTAAMVSWVDFLPTLVEAVGGDAPADIDGKSFLGVIRGEKKDHRDRIFTTHTGDGGWNIYPIRSVRTDRWKYIRNLHPEFAFTTHIDLSEERLSQRQYWRQWEVAAKTDPRAAEVVSGYRERPAEELYDLEADPHEQKNLAGDAEQAAHLAEMRAELDKWMREHGDKGMVVGKPRLLSDPKSYGAGAPSGDDWVKSGK